MITVYKGGSTFRVAKGAHNPSPQLSENPFVSRFDYATVGEAMRAHADDERILRALALIEDDEERAAIKQEKRK